MYSPYNHDEGNDFPFKIGQDVKHIKGSLRDSRYDLVDNFQAAIWLFVLKAAVESEVLKTEGLAPDLQGMNSNCGDAELAKF